MSPNTDQPVALASCSNAIGPRSELPVALSPGDQTAIDACRGATAGELEVVEGVPDGSRIPDLDGMASAFTPEYAPEEMFEIAKKLYAASR